MKKYLPALAITALLVLTAVISLASEPRTVRVGAFNYYPGIFKDSDGAVKGFYVDALADIGRRENLRFEYVPGSWSEGLERIKTGEVDLLTSVAFTPERAVFLDYGATPLLTVWGELYTLPVTGIDGIRQVQGKKIAIMKADVNGAHFIELTKKFAVSCQFVEVPGFDDVFKAVADRRVDAGVVNSTFGAAKQREYGLRSTGVVFNPFDIHFAVARGKHRELLVLLDRYLQNWLQQENSVYNQARQKWSHGTVGTIKVIPRWLTATLIILAVIAAVAGLFVMLLRVQVLRKTTELAQQSAERERIAATLLFINESGLYQRGDDLLASLTKHLGTCLGVEYAFVSQLTPTGLAARTRGMYAMGSRVQDVEYDINGTPCENVIGKELCFYPSDVTRIFPDDMFLAEIGAVGYAASPLWDSQGRGVGLLGIISRHQLQNPHVVKTILQIVATRAAQELEALSSLEELKLKDFTIDNITDAVYWIAEDGRIWDVNQAACRMLGYSKEELLTLTVLDINPDHSPERWRRLWKELKESGSTRIELLHRDRNGRRFPVEIHANFCRYGDFEYNCAVVHDISARKDAEAERLSLLEQLGQAQKMESVGRLAGGIAHDFNNLLTPIFCYTQVLMGKVSVDDSEFKMFDGIMQSAEKARILVQQLLSLGRRQVLEMQNIDLNAVVTSFYDILRRTIPENIGVRLQMTTGEYCIRADKSQLEQIVMNLVVNAADAISGNGVITIETAPATLDHEYVQPHEGLKPGCYLMLAVSDSGCGMGEETLAHIFEPFFTTKAVGEGTGLGLATVYGLVKQHGGHVAVLSEIGQGTVFKIYFPLINEAPATEIEPVSDITVRHSGGLTILLVEDDTMVRNMVYHLLLELGFSVIAAEGPQQAIAAHEGRHVDLLLTDVVMPDMSGAELYQCLAERRPDLKVLYMSGYTGSVIIEHGVIDDGHNLIMKPFAANDLGRRLETVLNYQQMPECPIA